MGDSLVSSQSLQAADTLGIISITYDCLQNIFQYDRSIGEKLTGTYDDRPLWSILLNDGAAKEDDVLRMRALFTRALTDSSVEKEKTLVQLCIRGGANGWFWMCVRGEYAEDGRAVSLQVLLLDVSDEMESRKQMQLRTVTDSLTGLLLRDVFLTRAGQRIKSAPPDTYVMVYFDIDKFSAINDRYGRAEGDKFLCLIAETLLRTIGDDSVCCRIHADCFAVCMRQDTKRMEQFIKCYQSVLHTANVPFEVHISFGLCVVDDPTVAPEIVLDHAAMAQRSIKGSYITRFAYYDDALRRLRLQRQEIEGQMNVALQKGQFRVYLQPQIDLATGKWIGAEALSRWFHPDRGLIMPGEFIPIFEQNGFISKLDSFVWERACQILQGWIREEGENAPSLSINISRVSLHNMNVARKLGTLTRQYGVPAKKLRLEVTESAYADNPMQLIDVVRDLQDAGFRVEMDDFGSGYSSLNTLKDVPVNTLKLDLRFLAGDTVSGRGGSIINSIIRMARWLQMPVVAEGVETEQQANYLRSIGCDYAQGYLYGKPMPVEEFDRRRHAGLSGVADETDTAVDMADANAFWNPDSQETLIFNSYVGGAAILEYMDGRVDLLRTNQKFRDMMRLKNIERFLALLETDAFPEDRARFVQMLNEAIATGDEATCTTRMRDREKGGENCLWVRNRVRPLCKSGNDTIFYLAVEDVTAEHEAQQRYHVSQDTLLAAAAHTHLQYWTYDMVRNTSVQGIEAKNNDTGLPKYIENYPQTLFDLGFIHPDHIELYRKLHTDLLAGARTVSADVLTGGEGRWEWRKVRYTAIEDEDGVVRSAIGTSESLTAYKALEQRFMIAAQQGGLMTWTLDLQTHSVTIDVPDGNGGRITELVQDMPETFIARGCVHPEDVEAFTAAYREMYGGAACTVVTVRCKAPFLGESDWRWKRMTFTAVADKDGRTGFAVCTGMDVTEQVNMQRRYREALTYYESLDPKDYISILHANITKGTVETSGGGTLPYERSIRLLTERMPDATERARMEAILRPAAFQREYEKGASRFTYEYHLTLSDGAVRWVRTTVRLLMDTGKQELCAFIYTQDINDEKMKSLVFERIVLEDYDFVTIIDTKRDRYITFITDNSDTFIPSADQYSFSDAAEIFALTTAPEEDAHLYIRKTRISYMVRRLTAEGSYSFLYHEQLPDGALRKKRMSLRLIDEKTMHVCLTRLDVEKIEEMR